MERVRRRRWAAWATAGALVAGAATVPAAAQTAPLTVPGGAVRISVGVGMDSWDDVLPGPGQPVPLDAAQATRLTGSLGLAIGLSSRFTLFGSVPFERMRVQAEAVDPAIDIPGDRAGGLGDATGGLAIRVAGAPSDAGSDAARAEIALLGRFPTGSVLRSAQYYTLTAGDGQSAFEAAARLHLPAGGLGVRLDGSYVMPFGETHTGLELEPRFTLGAAPWVRIAPSLALEAPVELLVRDEADGGSATAFGGGLAYFAAGRMARDGRRGLPIAAFLRVMKTLADDDAAEPLSVTAGLQLYYGLFR